ncbi:MAG: CBS domain-containing protein [Dongiaceae bacterium]
MERRIIPDVIGQRQQLLELPGSATVREAARRMRDRDVGAVLITEAGSLEGIFTERDVLMRIVALDRDPDRTRLSKVMTRNPDTIDADDLAITALSRLSERGYRHRPVMSKGRLVGIVSRRDFLGDEISAVEAEYGHEQLY